MKLSICDLYAASRNVIHRTTCFFLLPNLDCPILVLLCELETLSFINCRLFEQTFGLQIPNDTVYGDHLRRSLIKNYAVTFLPHRFSGALTSHWKSQLARSDSVIRVSVQYLNTLTTADLEDLTDAAVSAILAPWLHMVTIIPRSKADKSRCLRIYSKSNHFYCHKQPAYLSLSVW